MACFILIKNIIIITVMLIGLKYLPIKAKQKFYGAVIAVIYDW
jgi:hypothetical protein